MEIEPCLCNQYPDICAQPDDLYNPSDLRPENIYTINCWCSDVNLQPICEEIADKCSDRNFSQVCERWNTVMIFSKEQLNA